MRSIVLLLAIGFLYAGPAVADVCGTTGAAPVPAFEKAKARFLAGAFEGFYEIATPFVPGAKDRYEALMGPLERLVPEGFARCDTILQRRDSPGMVQEVVLFSTDVLTGPIGLYLVGGVIDGRVEVLEFAYNSRIGSLLDTLR